MTKLTQLIRRPFHRWHDPDQAMYIKGVPGYSVYGILKICDVCGKAEILKQPLIVTPELFENMRRAQAAQRKRP